MIFHVDNYCIDANTTAHYFDQKSTFWGKYWIIMVEFGKNLNTTAPKNPGRKLDWRHSIWVDMVPT